MHGQVVETLGRHIVSGQVAPGERLPIEPELANQLGVSRTALREAVKALAAKGLLELRPRTGTRVLPRSQWNVLDYQVLSWQLEVDPIRVLAQLTEVRYLIEPGGAALAARSSELSGRKELEETYQRMDRARLAKNGDAFTRADLDFHRALLKIGGNPFMSAFTQSFELVLHQSFVLSSELPGSIEQTVPLHRAVLDAVLTGDDQKAADSMRILIDTAASDLMKQAVSAGDERRPTNEN